MGGFNFRDISGTAPLGILEGMVYRSSQVFKCAHSLRGRLLGILGTTVRLSTVQSTGSAQ